MLQPRNITQMPAAESGKELRIIASLKAWWRKRKKTRVRIELRRLIRMGLT